MFIHSELVGWVYKKVLRLTNCHLQKEANFG